jgi:hypothetical protein
MMEPKHEANLHWQAFRYVAGEMSGDEAHGFEEQLAVEQTAREAVAEAAQLAQVVALADSQELVSLRAPAADGSSRMWQAAIWMGFGAAACLAIVLSAGWLDFTIDAPIATPAQSPNGAPQGVASDDAATLLAMSWLAAKDELAEQVDEGVEDQDSLIALLDSSEGETLVDDEGTERFVDDMNPEDAPPSWLLLAVSEEQGEPGPDGNQEEIE